MDAVNLPQRGGCLCGAVRYELNGAPLLVYACHCHACQTRSGSAFTLNMVARSADFFATGAIDILPQTTASGLQIEHSLCARCRFRIFAHRATARDFVSIRAGTLDNADWVKPIAQTCVESAIPWAIIPGVPAIAWKDFDFSAQGGLWRASAPRFVATDQGEGAARS